MFSKCSCWHYCLLLLLFVVPVPGQILGTGIAATLTVLDDIIDQCYCCTNLVYNCGIGLLPPLPVLPLLHLDCT